MQQLKSISDELSIIHQPLDNTDLVLYTLNGLGPEFREVAVAIRARETPIQFEELHEKLVDFVTYLKRQERASESLIPTAHVAQKSKSHSSKLKTSTGSSSHKQRPRSPTTNRNVIC